MAREIVDWSEDRLERLGVLIADNWSFGAIADELGVSRNAVAGRVSRMRAAGDPRAGEARRDPVKQQRDRSRAEQLALAEFVADYDPPQISDAARAIGLTYKRACELWQRIVRDLGWQAAA